MIAIHLCEVHYQMTIACDICWAFASMTMHKTFTDHQFGVQREVWQRVHGSVRPMKCMERLRSCKTWKRNWSLMSWRKCPNHRDRREYLSHAWARWVWINQRCCQEIMLSGMPLLCPPPFLLTWSCLATQVNECLLYLWMIPHSFPKWSHIAFLSEPSLSQINCPILFIGHSCCSVMVFVSCNYPGILFHILYWSLTILTYNFITELNF